MVIAVLLVGSQALRSAKQARPHSTADLAASSPVATFTTSPIQTSLPPSPNADPPSPVSTSGACGNCPQPGPPFIPHVCTVPPITPLNCGALTLETITQPGLYQYSLPGNDNIYFYLSYESSGGVRITVTFDSYPESFIFGNGTGSWGGFSAGAFAPLASGSHLVQVSVTSSASDKWAFYIRTDGPTASPTPTAVAPSPTPVPTPTATPPPSPSPTPAPSPSPTPVPTPTPTPPPSPSPTPAPSPSPTPT